MRSVQCRIPGLVLVEPTVHGDSRGFFAETWRADLWPELGIDAEFVQDNHSRSRRGTLRGMHFQTEPGQAKLVRCANGSVLDVAVDLRAGSPTFGQWESFVLDDREMRQLFIPIGFAHGFCVLSESADFCYRCSNYYDPVTEAGIAWDDPDVGIEWPDGLDVSVSDRDREAPRLSEIAASLPFRWS